MQANKFVKKFGWDAAKNIIDGWIRRDFDDSYHIADGIYCNLPFEPTDDCGTLSLYDLKRLLNSKARVAEHGTIERAKEYANSPYTAPEIKERLLQAIADVESCQ